MGGGMASAATHQSKNPAVGNHIMLAGLAFQVFTLLIFILLAVDFAFKTIRRVRTLKEDALDPTHAKLRASFKFKGFLVALIFATLCIFTRSVYRVAELSEGWTGHLISTQKYFIGLEGAIVAAGMLGLNAFHPAYCFQEGYEDRMIERQSRPKRNWFGRKGTKDADASSEGQRSEQIEKDANDHVVEA
jgi:hypothetical protein